MSVHVLATLDTKGHEADWVRRELRAAGLRVTVVDTGCLGEPQVVGDVSRQDLFRHGGAKWEDAVARRDRGEAVQMAAAGAARYVRDAHQRGQLSGVFGLGGSAGTTIATAAMRELPLEVPKLMVSTLASGDVRAFVGFSNILMLNSVVDIAGINRISRVVLRQAASAMVGMVSLNSPAAEKGSDDSSPDSNDLQNRPIIAATMFGVTTPCVEAARKVLEGAGFEVLVFHATGTGGQAMESLVRGGWIAGVLDITTTELADFRVGGVMSAGPERLTAAGSRGVPQVVSVGATDMVNFWAMESVPECFRSRQLYAHNPHVTLMRTTADECRQIGEEIARKVGAASGPSLVLLPLRGVSALDQTGQPFENAEARAALFDTIQRHLPAERVKVVDAHLNEPSFAELAARALIRMVRGEPS